MRMGVSIATTKLPIQLPAVVMDTAVALALRGKISLVTTHATGLHNTSTLYQPHPLQTCPHSPPTVGKVTDKQADKDDHYVASRYSTTTLTHSPDEDDGSC